MNGLARCPAGTAARPPTADINSRCVPPWRLGDHQWPRSLCWTSYALARNQATVAIDALGEGDILILRGASATLLVAGLFRVLLRTDLLSTRKCLYSGTSVSR